MAKKPKSPPVLMLPVGTQVVTRVDAKIPTIEPIRPSGTIGVIVKAPIDATHAYRIRFPDGAEVSLRRDELSVRREFQHEELRKQAGSVLAEYHLFEHVIYRCVVGSRAYGLEDETSDTDRRGVYLPPADLHWSLYGVPDQLENSETQECYWELQKFITLALNANPNILECLYTPRVEHATPIAEEMLGMRSIFLSRLVHVTYNGYVMSQFKKLEQDLRAKGEIRWKHAMHLIRLLLSGVTVLKEGLVPVRVEGHREALLRIKRGETPWDEINSWRLDLHRAFDEALLSTRLPERPDYEKANALLLKARRSVS